MLALYGSRSDAYESALNMLTHPSVTLHLFEESTHAILWEHTEEVISLMKTWLEGQRCASEGKEITVNETSHPIKPHL